jgi:hypothetical protein
MFSFSARDLAAAPVGWWRRRANKSLNRGSNKRASLRQRAWQPGCFLARLIPPLSAYTMQSLQKLNRQLVVHRHRLITEVGLSADEASKVATLVAGDIRFLSSKVKAEIEAASPVSISARIDELLVFQAWMDLQRSLPKHPTHVRAQVLVQNYICFVYLKDACFEVISKQAAPKSVAARCASHLSRGAVRDFRNAFSHANWQYNSTFTGLECWVRQNTRNRSGALKHFLVSQDDLTFWQALSRAVAYATYLQLGG